MGWVVRDTVFYNMRNIHTYASRRGAHDINSHGLRFFSLQSASYFTLCSHMRPASFGAPSLRLQNCLPDTPCICGGGLQGFRRKEREEGQERRAEGSRVKARGGCGTIGCEHARHRMRPVAWSWGRRRDVVVGSGIRPPTLVSGDTTLTEQTGD
jgi:hypothetical protein